MAKAPKDTQPAKVRMKRPHGFIDDDGANRHWEQGAIVTNPEDIALLAERNAEFEEVKDAE